MRDERGRDPAKLANLTEPSAQRGIRESCMSTPGQPTTRSVRVNGIAPGWYESEMTEDMFGTESGLRWIRRNTPMGRAGLAPELVGPIGFLLSDASSYITGTTLPVDGGWTSV